MKTMGRVKAAAERYASHHKGQFPQKVDDALMSFMIFGECDDKTYSSFSIPVNPFTGKRERLLTGKVSDPDQARRNPPAPLRAGMVEYSIARGGKDFAVRGGGRDGKALRDPNNRQRTLIYSHDPNELVKANMRTVQWAAESYAEDHRGKFPVAVDHIFKCYFPGGDPRHSKEGFSLPNPFTGRLEWPVTGRASVVKLERLKTPPHIGAGKIEYSASKSGSNYLIKAGGRDGRALTGVNGKGSTLVIAKDGDGGEIRD